MKVFVLEDEIHSLRKDLFKALKDAGHDLTVALSVEDGKLQYPKGQPYDYLILDHDMEGHYEYNLAHHNVGTRFVEWLIKHPQVGDNDDPQVILHSWNEPGRKAMQELLEEEGFVVRHFPYGPTFVKTVAANPLDKVKAGRDVQSLCGR